MQVRNRINFLNFWLIKNYGKYIIFWIETEYIRKWQNCHSWSSKRYHYSSFGRASYVNGLCSKMSGKLNVLHKSLECLNYFLRTAAEEVCFLGQRSLWLVLIGTAAKVIHTKYSKHRPSTVAHTFECMCSKINHGLNHGLFISLLKHINCPIHWIVYK